MVIFLSFCIDWGILGWFGGKWRGNYRVDSGGKVIKKSGIKNVG
jgi:hypothetical protein